MSCARTITLLCMFLESFPFDHLNDVLCQALQVENHYSYLNEFAL